MSDDFEMFDPDFGSPRICATRHVSEGISAKQGKDEVELIMSVYNVSEAEAWKILKKKVMRRKERAELRRKESEEHESSEMVIEE